MITLLIEHIIIQDKGSPCFGFHGFFGSACCTCLGGQVETRPNINMHQRESKTKFILTLVQIKQTQLHFHLEIHN